MTDDEITHKTVYNIIVIVLNPFKFTINTLKLLDLESNSDLCCGRCLYYHLLYIGDAHNACCCIMWKLIEKEVYETAACPTG
jgi:hypothetical protein